MTRSIELGWVARFDKSLPLPELAIAPNPEYGGLYYPPHESEELIGERHYDRRHGIVFVSESYPDDMGDTIAHEWRHHWQAFHGTPSNHIGWNSPKDYDMAIVEYFTRSTTEADALRFQYRRAGVCEHWQMLLRRVGFVFA